MVVCFSIGSSSEQTAERIKSVVDNATIYTFNSISDVIKDATLRHINYNRIFISNAIIQDAKNELQELNNFIKNYSSKTEIILYLNKKHDNMNEVAKEFNELFNSPMYASILLEKTTMRVLIELITKSMIEIKEVYKDFLFVVPEELAKDYKISPISSDVSDNTSNKKEIESDYKDKMSEENLNNTSSNNSEIDLKSNLGKLEYSKSSDFISDISSEGSIELDFNTNLPEEDELTLGVFGSSHSDTGFLTSKEDEELQEYIKNQSNNKPFEQEEKPVGNICCTNIKVNNIDKNNKVISLSPRTFDTSLSIIDTALHLANVEYKSVLLVDLDYKKNTLLSYLNINRFYNSNCNFGIKNVNVYLEDGVGILSNGYGIDISNSDVVNLISNHKLDMYDKIIIYCPTDCLDIVPIELLEQYFIELNVGGNLTTFIDVSSDLSNRLYTSIEKERYISKNCYVNLNKENTTDEDLKILKNRFLFTTNSWVDNI